MGSSRTLPALLLALLAGASAAPARADALYLHVVPATRARGATLEEGAPVRVAAYVARPEDLAERLPANVRSLSRDHVVLDLAQYPQLEPTAPEAFLRSSFVVDFDEPSVKALHAKLATAEGALPSIEELRRFADEAIPRKSMERGWDLASQVAASGVGDCSEHAVLLAALARASGRPARVALGFLVAVQEGRPFAFGHAWTEIHDGTRWVPVDATPAARELSAPTYLPVTLLEDEGPGYALPLASVMQRTWVRRLEVR